MKVECPNCGPIDVPIKISGAVNPSPELVRELMAFIDQEAQRKGDDGAKP